MVIVGLVKWGHRRGCSVPGLVSVSQQDDPLGLNAAWSRWWQTVEPFSASRRFSFNRLPPSLSWTFDPGAMSEPDRRLGGSAEPCIPNPPDLICFSLCVPPPCWPLLHPEGMCGLHVTCIIFLYGAVSFLNILVATHSSVNAAHFLHNSN